MRTYTRWIAALVLVVLVAAAGSVAAQTTDWSATLTVGQLGDPDGSNVYNGYNAFEGGSLSDTKFVYEGTTYTISTIQEQDGFFMTLIVLPGIPEPRTSPLVFEAEGYGSLRFDEAIQHGGDETYSLHNWIPEWDWTVGETITLRLIGAQPVQPVPAVPAVGLVLLTALLAGSHLRRRWGR